MSKWTNLLIGLALTRSAPASKIYGEFQEYAVPLIRCERYYKHNKEAGMDPKAALIKAAADAEVPLDKAFDYLKRKVGHFGDIGRGELLESSGAYDPDAVSYKKTW